MESAFYVDKLPVERSDSRFESFDFGPIGPTVHPPPILQYCPLIFGFEALGAPFPDLGPQHIGLVSVSADLDDTLMHSSPTMRHLTVRAAGRKAPDRCARRANRQRYEHFDHFVHFDRLKSTYKYIYENVGTCEIKDGSKNKNKKYPKSFEKHHTKPRCIPVISGAKI